MMSFDENVTVEMRILDALRSIEYTEQLIKKKGETVYIPAWDIYREVFMPQYLAAKWIYRHPSADIFDLQIAGRFITDFDQINDLYENH